MTYRQTINIPTGYIASFTTGSQTSGTYRRIDHAADAVNVTYNTGYTIGPFNEPRVYALDFSGNKADVSFTFSGMFTAEDDASVTAALALKANAVAAANIAEITASATGAEIALAVNSIIMALIQAGIVQDEV